MLSAGSFISALAFAPANPGVYYAGTDRGQIFVKTPGSGNWTTAENWSTGSVPGPDDDVVIDTASAATVAISSGNSVSVRSLTTGGNENKIQGNRIWDNWRRGTMMIGVPNQVSELDGGAGPGSTGGVIDRRDNVQYATGRVMAANPRQCSLRRVLGSLPK